MSSIAIELTTRLPERIAKRLRLPLISAPMLHVSGPDLVVAACRAGVIGAFPTANPFLLKVSGGLDAWLTEMTSRLGDDLETAAPICPNIIMRNEDLNEHVEAVIRHGIEMVITSVGSPKPIMPRLREAGVFVFSDVATIEHARKAADSGVDGLVLLTAGAGGQTGWLNPFAYVRAVRSFFDGPIVLAGGVIDGVALRAAQVLGCDLGYMGTKFIATRESLADESYRNWLVQCSMDDVLMTKAFNGLMGSYLKPTIAAAGLDPDNLDESISVARAKEQYGGGNSGPRRWIGMKSAGHSVSGVTAIQSVAELVDQTAREFEGSRLEVLPARRR
ncbi:MAG TPA: nitronate monooxygenase [Lichenihabitans sp.]|nr:nitronate monooxygenase [Lichenihabitans sp.]